MNTTIDRTAVRDMTPIVLGLMPFGLLIGLTISTHRAGAAGGLGSVALIFGGTPHPLGAHPDYGATVRAVVSAPVSTSTIRPC